MRVSYDDAAYSMRKQRALKFNRDTHARDSAPRCDFLVGVRHDGDPKEISLSTRFRIPIRLGDGMSMLPAE